MLRFSFSSSVSLNASALLLWIRNLEFFNPSLGTFCMHIQNFLHRCSWILGFAIVCFINSILFPCMLQKSCYLGSKGEIVDDKDDPSSHLAPRSVSVCLTTIIVKM